MRGLAVSQAGNLYVGGAFTTPRRFAAKANAATGVLIPAFAPVISNSLGTSPEVRAIAVNPGSTRVILGGFFNQLNSGAPGDPNTTNLGVGAVDATTGASVRGTGTRLTCRRSGPSSCSTSPRTARRCSAPAPATAGRPFSWNMETGALNYIEGFNGNVVGVGVADGMFYMGGHYSGYCGPIPGNNFCDRRFEPRQADCGR